MGIGILTLDSLLQQEKYHSLLWQLTETLTHQVLQGEAEERLHMLSSGLRYGLVISGQLYRGQFASFEEWRTALGNRIAGRSTISEKMQVFQRYVWDYGLGTVTDENGQILRSYAQCVETILAGLVSTESLPQVGFRFVPAPVLLSVTAERLYKLLKHHSTAEEAVEMLKQAQVLSRSEFMAWVNDTKPEQMTTDDPLPPPPERPVWGFKPIVYRGTGVEVRQQLEAFLKNDLNTAQTYTVTIEPFNL